MDYHQPTIGKMIFSAVFYGVCSGSMNFINKYLMTILSFPFPSVMIFFQLIFLVIILKLLKTLGFIHLATYDLKTAKSLIFQSILYSANTALALVALNGMNVPMYNALRRCSPLASMILAYLVFTKKPTKKIFISIIIITSGAIIAAHGDLTFDLKAYVFGSFSVLLMALNLTMVQYNGSEKMFSTNDLTYINALNCIPALGCVCLYQFSEIMMTNPFKDYRFLPTFLIVISSGCLLNYSMFLCTTTNSALTTTCVGVIKSVATTIIGLFAFGGVTTTAPFILGQTLNFAGAVMYAYSKYQQRTKEIFPK